MIFIPTWASRIVDDRAGDAQVGWQEAVRGRHRAGTIAECRGVEGKFRVGRLGLQKLLHVALDEIKGERLGQGREGGGVGADSDLHGDLELSRGRYEAVARKIISLISRNPPPPA